MAGHNDKMIYRHLGRTGLKVSALSYGAWVTFGNQVDTKLAKELLTACNEAGINFYDNAEVYAGGDAERVMGQAIKELGWKRSDVVVSTKLFWGGSGPNDKGLSRKHIIEGTKQALERLQMDYVDLIFCHRPDPVCPIEETVRAMNFVIDQGWAYYWGTSEWTAQQITEAWEVANKLGLIGPAMEQPEYNMLHRQKIESDYVPIYQKYGLGTTIWSPLSSGVLTGKYSKDHIPPDSRLAMEKYKGSAQRKLVDETLTKVDKLKPIAQRLDASLAQLSIAWCVKNKNVSTTILGASKLHQLEENLKALDVLPKLTDEVMKEIESILNNKPDPVATYR
ncbi:hypothetical protein WJX74_002086 [Apatococcus lobatus]|uniref:NADP-dependent oxidoreductase domain-containing protein n=1 Tax=Apatococcus lobatus TaxID=904363 RepID=A0AAW1RP18_9CHLO